MPIFKTVGYRDNECVLSIAAIFPPDSRYRQSPDKKHDEELTFHLTIVNFKDTDDEKSAYIQLSKNQLKGLNSLIENYLRTGITKEL